MINRERFAERLAALAAIGADEKGGTTRLALTEAYREALDLVKAWMREAGMSCRLDGAANLIGRLPGRDPDAKPVVIGSHIDTVVNAGNYDGVVGVLAGLEIAAHLHETGSLPGRPLEVIAFSEEEGARFGSGVFGSRAMAGQITCADLEVCDADGISRRQAIAAFGGDPERLFAPPPPSDAFAVYLELHIEQGPILEAQGAAVGVVTGIVGMLVAGISFEGEASHAGSTPMGMRRDALLGACELALAVERLCTAAGYAHVGTVGVMNAHPGGVNVVPARADMTLDIRDIDEAVIARTYEAIRIEADAIARRRGLTVCFEPRMQVKPALCDPAAMALFEAACRRRGTPYHTMPSGAGHDAQLMGMLSDMGMLFVRSQGGHSPDEHAEMEDIMEGVQILFEVAQIYLNPYESRLCKP